MRYVTTRIKEDKFEPMVAISQGKGPEGGFFLPEQLPVLTEKQLMAIAELPFPQACAEIINLLFDTRLDGWAVSFAIGRYPIKIIPIGNRTIVAETWHNPAWRFERLARGVEKAIRQSDQISSVPTSWMMISARLTVLFGIFAELMRAGTVSLDAPIDLVVPVGDFTAVIACRYARQMGLPIHNILCCCNENAAAWNLIHKGELRTETTVTKTCTPMCDTVIPDALECLIFDSLGMKHALEFAETVRKGGNFYLEPHELQQLRQGLFATVVSGAQMESAVSTLYSSCGYLADPYTALCVAGIGQYRSKTRESRQALILSDESQKNHLNVLARCLGTTAEELKKVID